MGENAAVGDDKITYYLELSFFVFGTYTIKEVDQVVTPTELRTLKALVENDLQLKHCAHEASKASEIFYNLYSTAETSSKMRNLLLADRSKYLIYVYKTLCTLRKIAELIWVELERSRPIAHDSFQVFFLYRHQHIESALKLEIQWALFGTNPSDKLVYQTIACINAFLGYLAKRRGSYIDPAEFTEMDLSKGTLQTRLMIDDCPHIPTSAHLVNPALSCIELYQVILLTVEVNNYPFEEYLAEKKLRHRLPEELSSLTATDKIGALNRFMEIAIPVCHELHLVLKHDKVHYSMYQNKFVAQNQLKRLEELQNRERIMDTHHLIYLALLCEMILLLDWHDYHRRTTGTTTEKLMITQSNTKWREFYANQHLGAIEWGDYFVPKRAVDDFRHRRHTWSDTVNYLLREQLREKSLVTRDQSRRFRVPPQILNHAHRRVLIAQPVRENVNPEEKENPELLRKLYSIMSRDKYIEGGKTTDVSLKLDIVVERLMQDMEKLPTKEGFKETFFQAELHIHLHRHLARGFRDVRDSVKVFPLQYTGQAWAPHQKRLELDIPLRSGKQVDLQFVGVEFSLYAKYQVSEHPYHRKICIASGRLLLAEVIESSHSRTPVAINMHESGYTNGSGMRSTNVKAVLNVAVAQIYLSPKAISLLKGHWSSEKTTELSKKFDRIIGDEYIRNLLTKFEPSHIKVQPMHVPRYPVRDMSQNPPGVMYANLPIQVDVHSHALCEKLVKHVLIAQWWSPEDYIRVIKNQLATSRQYDSEIDVDYEVCVNIAFYIAVRLALSFDYISDLINGSVGEQFRNSIVTGADDCEGDAFAITITYRWLTHYDPDAETGGDPLIKEACVQTKRVLNRFQLAMVTTAATSASLKKSTEALKPNMVLADVEEWNCHIYVMAYPREYFWRVLMRRPDVLEKRIESVEGQEPLAIWEQNPRNLPRVLEGTNSSAVIVSSVEALLPEDEHRKQVGLLKAREGNLRLNMIKNYAKSLAKSQVLIEQQHLDRDSYQHSPVDGIAEFYRRATNVWPVYHDRAHRDLFWNSETRRYEADFLLSYNEEGQEGNPSLAQVDWDRVKAEHRVVYGVDMREQVFATHNIHLRPLLTLGKDDWRDSKMVVKGEYPIFAPKTADSGEFSIQELDDLQRDFPPPVRKDHPSSEEELVVRPYSLHFYNHASEIDAALISDLRNLLSRKELGFYGFRYHAVSFDGEDQQSIALILYHSQLTQQ